MIFEGRGKSKRKAQVEWPGLFFRWEQAALALSAILPENVWPQSCYLQTISAKIALTSGLIELARTLKLGFISEDAFKRLKISGFKINGCSWRLAGYLPKKMLKNFYVKEKI